MCVCVCVCERVRVCTRPFVNVCINACYTTNKFLYMCFCVYIQYVYMYECMFVRANVYEFVDVLVSVHAFMHDC